MAIPDDKIRVMITIEKELKEELEKEAKEDNRSLSNYIGHLLINRTSKKETGN